MDELIDALGRAQIEAELRLSAEGVAGAVASGQERRGDRVARTRARDGVPERAKVAGGAAPSAEEGSGQGWRGGRPGLRTDASRREAGPPDVGDSAARSFDAPVWSGVTGDGGDGGVSQSAVSRETIEASEEEANV